MISIRVLQDDIEIHRIDFSLETSALTWLSVNLEIEDFDSAEEIEEDGKIIKVFTI